MTLKPTQKGKKTTYISLLFAVTSIASILVSGIVQKFGGFYQLTAIICGVVAIEMYLKYIGSFYIYDAADDYFKVYKITGKRSICVSSLDYAMSLSGVVKKEEYENNKKQFPKTNFNINLCKNFAPESYSLYFFEFNGKKCMMKFEPDEPFSDYLNKKIEEAKNKETYENEI